MKMNVRGGEQMSVKVGFIYPKTEYPDGTDMQYVNGTRVPSSTPYSKIYDFECECGCKSTMVSTQEIIRNKIECPQCHSKNIVEFDRKYKTKMFNAKFELTSREGKNFTISSTRYKANFNRNKDSITIKELGIDEISFTDGRFSISDYRDKEYREGYGEINDIRNWIKRKDIKAVDLMHVIARDEDEFIYLSFLYSNFKNTKSRSYYGDPCLFTALKKDYYSSTVETLYKAGFKHKFIKDVDRYIYSLNSSKDGEKKKKLHQIFDIPKYAMRLVRRMDSYYSHEKRQLQRVCEKIDGNNFNVIMDIIESETLIDRYNVLDLLNYITELKDLGYSNLQALTNYICRRTKLEQGLYSPIESARLLKDYVSIMKELNFNPEKYPTSLKKVHDIAVMNKNALSKTAENSKFMEKIVEDEYLELEMKDKMFSVITPKSSDDLIKEGESLSHCVASYVKDVANGLCKIFFLRFTKEPEESYMTIEVRNNEIKQFKGVSNRRASDLDLEFIGKWAEKKNLVLRNSDSL